MRTEAIERACGRFEAWLAPRLGPAVDVTGTRVAFDATGWSVSCRAVTPDGALDLRLGDRQRWQLGGPAAARAALEARLDDARVADAVTRLRDEVGPQRPRREPLTAPRARALLGEDGARLADTVDAFARYYGQPLEAVWLDGDDTPSVGYPPVVTDQELLMYAPPPFRQDAHMVAYVEDLGFAVDPRDRVFAVPVPSVFERRRARLGVEGGLRPELQVLRATLYSPRAWLTQIARGVFPMNVHGRLSRGLAAARRLPLHRSQRAKLNNHFHALGHDMGIHTLAMHRVPWRRMAELRRLARVALSRGRARAAASFFEERLTRACVDTWAEATAPADFEPRFASAFPALRAELARIAHG
ncbi:MAG: hypothetical protein H6719_24810 [Sandaracinaceae bacterium]|nr:hypothetical protein [Sandaracinaceae bacterium]